MEIVENNIEKIGVDVAEKYRNAIALASSGRETLRQAVIELANCGEMLVSARSIDSKLDVLALAERYGMDRGHAQKAIHLSRNRDQLELDLWPQDVAKIGAQFVGVLPPPGSSNREKLDPERGKIAFHWFTFANKLTQCLQGMLAIRPPEEMTTDERQALDRALRPIVEAHKLIAPSTSEK